MINMSFGKLTVLSRQGTDTRRNATWSCKCQCGKTKIVSTVNLKSGRTLSCGCLRSESKKRHGLTGSPTWNTWSSMIKRCTLKTHNHYDSYGGKGIKVCKSWMIFENFLHDMGLRPLNKTLDRINPAKGYFKENCRWATPVEQTANRKDAVLFTIGAITKTAKQWSLMSGTPASTITYRHKLGLPDNIAVYGSK